MSDYHLVVAVSNPASVEPLARMGCALARANNASITFVSVTEMTAQMPVRADDALTEQHEAIVERGLSIATSAGVSAEGKAPPSHRPVRSIASIVESKDATGLLVGSDELIPFKRSLLGRTFLEQLIEQVPCDVYIEQIGPARAIPGDSILVPVASGAHAHAVADVASDIAKIHDMEVHLVTVVSPTADADTINQTEQRLRTYVEREVGTQSEISVIPGEDVVETIVGLTSDHDVTVLGATNDSTLSQLLSGTVPTGLAKRSQNTLLLVHSSL